MRTALVAIVIGLAASLGVAAQHDDPSLKGAAAALEGTWRVEITLRNCVTWAPVGVPFPAMASFARGGTVVTSDGGMSPAARGAGHGVWWRLQGRHFAAITEAFLFTDGVRSGTQRLVQEIEVDADGGRFESRVWAAVLDAIGNVTFTGCASSAGTRMD